MILSIVLKLDITQEDYHKSGVYIIKSMIDNKIYIGSTKDFITRYKTHKSKLYRGIHHSVYLQNFYNKYGNEKLTFSIIEFCDKEHLIKREQYWLDKLKPQFNTRKIAENNEGTKRTQEQKDKISKGVLKNLLKFDLHPNCKLNKIQVIEIKEMLMYKTKVKQIVQKTGVSRFIIEQIKNKGKYNNINL